MTTGKQLILITALCFLLMRCGQKAEAIVPGEMKEVVFVLPDSTAAGDYVFDFENGKNADYPLCFCLSERNNFPPGCKGNVLYVSHNFKNIPAVPATIGIGCMVEEVKTGIYATTLLIDANYKESLMKDSVFIGFMVPPSVKEGATASVQINYYKKNNNTGELTRYLSLTKDFLVKRSKAE